MEEDI